MLYGISLLYGLTGTLDLSLNGGRGRRRAAAQLGDPARRQSGARGRALVLVLSGFAYKISAAPFHF